MKDTASTHASHSASDGVWLNRNVFGMGLTSLLSDLGHESATAVLPGFMAALGISPAILGAMEGIADAVSSFVKLGAGWWSDRVGKRKPISTIGYAMTACCTGIFAFAHGAALIVAGRVVAWLGRGIRGPLRDAMLADSVSAADRGKAFGFHRAGDTVGAILGPILAAGLLAATPVAADASDASSFRMVFLLSIIPGLAAAVVFGAMVREPAHFQGTSVGFRRSLRELPADFRRFLLAVGLFGIGDFSPTLLILTATTMLTPEYGIAKAGQIAALLYALRNVVYAACSYPIGALSDRINRRVLLGWGYLLAAMTMTMFGLLVWTGVASIACLAVLFSFAGAFIAAEDALEATLTADLVTDASARGLAFGVLGTVNGVGDFCSSAVVGALLAIEPVAGFAFAAALMFAGAALVLRRSSAKHPNTSAWHH